VEQQKKGERLETNNNRGGEASLKVVLNLHKLRTFLGGKNRRVLLKAPAPGEGPISGWGGKGRVR